ncbi:MAG: alpha-hydroxy-acid oxidizing protein [Deltaproteobacteria bacterium]|nr:alpha-hydroxy-acid oxidizing protein [Deltaproteobacteria bacterium]
MSETPSLSPRPAPPRFPVLRPRRIVRGDRCINCGTCIEACLYGCHERDAADPRKMAEPKEACCRNCFACVLGCPRGALGMHPSETYRAQGRGPFSPDVVRTTLEEAAEGKIPVSGAGYGGPFDGDGFDGIWTDMSEIVRPTRDGIHGREQISTVVGLGRKLGDLCGARFDEEGNLRSEIPSSREISIPVLFDLLPFHQVPAVLASLALAASRLTTYATVRAEDDLSGLSEWVNHLIVRLRPQDVGARQSVVEWASIVALEPGPDRIAAIERARATNPHVLTIVRVPVSPEAPGEVLSLARAGAGTIHLFADPWGRGQGGAGLLDCLRACHGLLVEKGQRDLVSLVASGGIALAEHVPKTIISGADAVAVEVPLLVALECALCETCEPDASCPRGLPSIDPRWGATRVINLMLSWRDQLLEVLGAMGLRDVRRLRGESGRAIFADQARRDFFARLGEGRAPAPVGPPIRVESEPPSTQARSSCPRRFPTNLGAFHVKVDRGLCTDCGICAASCRLGVHRRLEGKALLEEPLHDRCVGPACTDDDWCCVRVCPWRALSIEGNGVGEVLGDRRWTPDLLMDGWHRARTGAPAGRGPVRGGSGGGFDVIQLVRPPNGERRAGSVDLSIPLNRRSEGPRISIPLPIYGGGMSYGSISLAVMLGRAMAARELGTFISTGEGGYPEALLPFADHVITQIATGLFGVREETIQRARMVELKYAQGAKPGLGGHLLGEKNTSEVAAMRQAVPGTSLFSPFPFHSVYSVEDHKKHLDWVRAIHPDVLVSVKVSTPGDIDMVAVGSYYAGANVVHLDGSYGGTGAAPDIAKKNIAQPIEYAIAQTHDFLVKEGIRDEVTLMASGGIRSPEDVLSAIALGADGVVIGTAELVAIDCVRCGNCERGRGCPIGIATTDPVLSLQLTSELVRDRIVNLYRSWAATLSERLSELGLESVGALRGRRDLLERAEDAS